MSKIQNLHKHAWRVVRGLNSNGQVQFECRSCKERA